MITLALCVAVILLTVACWCILSYCKLLKEAVVDLEAILGEINSRLKILENKPTDQ
jgi:hypothetical protein